MKVIFQIRHWLGLLLLLPFSLAAQDTLPVPADSAVTPLKTGFYELNMPPHWKATHFAPLENGKLLIAGIENNFDDFASLFFVELTEGGVYKELFSLELLPPVPSNSDFHLYHIGITPTGMVEALGTVSKHGKAPADSIVRYEISREGRVIRRIARPNPHPGRITRLERAGRQMAVLGAVADAEKVETPFISLLDDNFKEVMHQSFEPYWELNDMVLEKDGGITLCGYLPRHGIILIHLLPDGTLQAPKPGFVDGNAIQIVRTGNPTTLLVQGFDTGLQTVSEDLTPGWNLALKDATLSILGDWAKKPAIELKDGAYFIAAARHESPRLEHLRIYKVNAAGEMIWEHEIGSFQEVKACFVQELSDSRLRVMVYVRDAWDWNLHVLEAGPGGMQ